MKNLKFYIFVIVLLNCFACDVINPEEEIPAYIHVKDFNVSSSISQGTPDAKVTDGYLYINNDFLGIYELPKTIPVLASGTTDIKIDPGVKENGIAATPDIYPFFKRFSTSRDLQPGQVDTITPVTTYIDEANFAYLENFELGNTLNFDADGDTMNLPVIITNDAYDGRSIRFSVNENNTHAEIATQEFFNLPTNGNQTFLEIHYKNDALFEVGLIGYQQNSATPLKSLVITLNPRDTWNKIYINLTDPLIESSLAQYQLLFVGNLPPGETQASFYLDNVKLIHL